jgi:ribose 5-phosphate isomerase B
MGEMEDQQLRAIVHRVVSQAAGLASPEDAQPTEPAPAGKPAPGEPAPAVRVVAIGSDHGGFELKEALKAEIAGLGYQVRDVGTNSKEAVDYPDFAQQVARLVGTGQAWRGIAIDGAGIGSCMVANKVPGVRAGMAYDLSSAVNGREHNDANVLTLGAGLIGGALARQIVRAWLTTEFGGGRHVPRVEKIAAIEKQYLKPS